jgi:hypothetical protein
VTLGNQPVSVGSDSRACAVYAQGAPPVACRFRFDGGKVTCQDAVSGRVEVMKPGDRKTVGAVRVVVGAAREPELVGAR